MHLDRRVSPPSLPSLTIIAFFAAVTPAPAQVGHESYSRPVDRRFTYIEETLHGAPPGHFEFEQWVTWSHGTRSDSELDRFDFKHELEYGISEGVHFAVDLVEWHTGYERGEWHTRYDATGAELKFRFSDPRTDGVGFGFKTELGLGPRELEWENTLILDKIVERWEGAYNLTVETEFEGDKTFHYEEGEVPVKQSLGASYEVDPTFYLGGEFVHGIPPEWSWGDRQNFFIGPNAAIRGEQWACIATALFLADGVADAPRFQLRLIVEFDF